MPTWNRRQALEAALAGVGTYLIPRHYARAQSGGAPLIKAPKRALLIGNNSYPQSPLSNPRNDANGMAQVLKELGFNVVVGLDLKQADMRDAIRAFAESLSKTKAVGLFYFAGHGAQLAWRNYLIPVDAKISDAMQLRERAVDLSGLIEGIRGAGNPMNLVILDACRDNPFGNTTGVDQKGLSQMDAPPGTLLAYATAPGNTAIDGDGSDHGLYTEQLLRELKVPEAKVEDVFKRVRLAVRRRSNGLQIPWESTSLEEDFWFIPPKIARTLADEEVARAFEQELALWQKIQNETRSEPFENYLRHYPNGRFAELAQLHLDRLLAAQGEKRIQIASSEGNPFTKGSAQANIRWKVGDRYTYRLVDLTRDVEIGNNTQAIVTIGHNEVHYGNSMVTDLLGNTLRRSGGRIYSPNQLQPVEYVVGKQWTTQFRITTPSGQGGLNEMELRIVSREQITVPAGTFNAYRIEGRGAFENEAGKVEITHLTKWMDPERVRREVAMEEIRERPRAGRERRPGQREQKPEKLRVVQAHRWELVSYKESQSP